MITALIDGDWILYAAGFAGQRPECCWVPDNGLIPPVIRRNKTEIATFIGQEHGYKITEGKLYSRDVLDPPAHFFHSGKRMIESQCEKIAEKFGDEVRPNVLLDGDGNFRSRLATIRPYKGNRAAQRPLMFNELRNYLLDAWGAKVVFDQETDDALAIDQTAAIAEGRKTVIVGVDKDMLQVPGWHLNPNKGFKHIREVEGRKRLYAQAAMGDSVDNIAGCYKVGAKAARSAFGQDMQEERQWELLVGLYEASILKHGKHIYGGLSGQDAALENMRLVYLRRQPDELWMPPAERES